MSKDYPDITTGEVPDKWGNSPVIVSAYQHPKKYCGLFVVLTCGDGSVKFRHSMTGKKAREMAEMLTAAADFLDREAIPYPDEEPGEPE